MPEWRDLNSAESKCAGSIFTYVRKEKKGKIVKGRYRLTEVNFESDLLRPSENHLQPTIKTRRLEIIIAYYLQLPCFTVQPYFPEWSTSGLFWSLARGGVDAASSWIISNWKSCSHPFQCNNEQFEGNIKCARHYCTVMRLGTRWQNQTFNEGRKETLFAMQRALGELYNNVCA